MIADKIAECLLRASTCYPSSKVAALERALANESSESARWLLGLIVENGVAAKDIRKPLCDDTGIPHVLVEVGERRFFSGEMLAEIEEGIARGLRLLPGRPMAVRGVDEERLEQSLGMFDDPAAVEMAPVAVRRAAGDVLRAHVLMLGGGPAIRGRSYRVFHRHDVECVEKEITSWAVEACSQLGCTPCTLAIGIGRSHYEAGNLMLQAMVDGDYGMQSPLENRITQEVNSSRIGPMGMGGDTTVLATFAKVGPARASGVRIVCMRPCCCFEPRIATVDL